MRRFALCLVAMLVIVPQQATALSPPDKRLIDTLISGHNNCYKNKTAADAIGRLLLSLQDMRFRDTLVPADRSIIRLAKPVVSICEKWPSARWTQLADSLPAAD